jgi:hypothetical protein
LERRPDTEVVTYERRFEPERDHGLLEGIVFQATSNQWLSICSAEQIEKLCKKNNLRFITSPYHGLYGYTFHSMPPGLRYGSDTNIPVWVGATALSGILSIHSAFVKPLNIAKSIDTLNIEDGDLVKVAPGFPGPLD